MIIVVVVIIIVIHLSDFTKQPLMFIYAIQMIIISIFTIPLEVKAISLHLIIPNTNPVHFNVSRCDHTRSLCQLGRLIVDQLLCGRHILQVMMCCISVRTIFIHFSNLNSIMSVL